jgi:hypothetical protein
MFKRIFTILLCVGLLLSCAACGNNSNNDLGIDDLLDNNDKSSAINGEYFVWITDTMIDGLTEEGMKQTTLVIPATCESADGLTSEALKKVTFENSNTEIGAMAFSECTALETVILPTNLKIIEIKTFQGCTSLKTIEIPDSVTEIGYGAFRKCSALEKVTLGNNVTLLGSKAFDECVSLVSVVIPDSVTVLEDEVFKNCAALNNVTFGAGIESIGESAFENCVSLTKIELPEGLKSLGEDAFSYCDALEEIYLPQSVEEMSMSCIAQTHNFKVYLYEGSYCDEMFNSLRGFDYMEKIYR